MIIQFTGRRGSGKTTAAFALLKELHSMYRRPSMVVTFAGRIKRISAEIFKVYKNGYKGVAPSVDSHFKSYIIDMLNSDTVIELHSLCLKYHNSEDVEVRKGIAVELLQMLGTAAREQYRADYWVDYIQDKIHHIRQENLDIIFINDDMRFSNELLTLTGEPTLVYRLHSDNEILQKVSTENEIDLIPNVTDLNNVSERNEAGSIVKIVIKDVNAVPNSCIRG